MPSCSGRNILYALMALQLISTLERQIFDFLGYMWLPILGNFVHTLIVILGIFGVYQYTSIHMIVYLLWCLIWIGWNVFIICYYLGTGNLNDHDILSFGTGSFSWWLVNNIGCKAEYFASNDTTSIPSLAPTTPFYSDPGPPMYKPVKPSTVAGCILEFQYVEVIHAGIQVGFSMLALVFGIPLTHYLITVVEPKYRQANKKQKLGSQNSHAMYSIEYNQVQNSENHGLQETQSTDFYSLETTNGNDVRPHMTPRRVKRRSYTRSSARSAGKALKKDLRQSGRSIRSASGALGANKNSKSINPVNRLMQETEPRQLINDSSTSNDDGTRNVERYGQVNPGYVSSRPNSLYSQANHNGPTSITDYEASRPPSALTSYSNFHGQRRPGMPGLMANHKPHQNGGMMNQLTQESLNHDSSNRKQQQNLHNASFDDDLPPPPPPLSSSPTLGHRNNDQDTDNNSSITTDTTAQVNQLLALALILDFVLF